MIDTALKKYLFESRPNFPVSANLYLPEVSPGSKVPGVVGTCGHSANGKAAEAYQSFAQGLARLGYACLIFDPIGQGERLQYPDEDNKSRIGVGVREHIQCGNQQLLVGENLAMWRVGRHPRLGLPDIASRNRYRSTWVSLEILAVAP